MVIQLKQLYIIMMQDKAEQSLTCDLELQQ